MKISYIFNNNLYYLDKQLYETDVEVFKRLWYILNNKLSVNNTIDINNSKKYLNELNGMIYED